MYRLREMDVNDKVCEQVSMTMLSEVYPTEVIERCVQQSEPWSSKVRRVRLSTALTLVVFVIAMALWSRRNQCQVWQSLVGRLSDIHPAEPKSTISDSGLSGRRKELGSQCLEALMRERCQVIAQPSSMPDAFFRRYRLMAIDGTVFNTPDTKANSLANAAQQQSIRARRLSAGALCALGRVWASCGGWARDRWLRYLGSAWGAPLTGADRSEYAGPGGCRHHLGRVHRARTRARGSSPGGLGSRSLGTAEPPTPTV